MRLNICERSVLLLILFCPSGCAFEARPGSSLRNPASAWQRDRPDESSLLHSVQNHRWNVPADSELVEEIRETLDFRLREDFDRWLDAKDPGELLEHATLTQVAIDRGIFGLDALFVFCD